MCMCSDFDFLKVARVPHTAGECFDIFFDVYLSNGVRYWGLQKPLVVQVAPPGCRGRLPRGSVGRPVPRESHTRRLPSPRGAYCEKHSPSKKTLNITHHMSCVCCLLIF